MRSDVQALLDLQADDVSIRETEERLETLEPRLAELERERNEAVGRLEQLKAALAAEEARHRQLQSQQSEHHDLQQRATSQLENIRKPKEATAAMLQLDQVGRFLAADAGALEASSLRLSGLRDEVEMQQEVLRDLEERQQSERGHLAEERQAIEKDLADARKKREEASRRVTRDLLSTYDRIRRRASGGAVYALRGSACGNCDTAIPLQRRSVMSQTGAIELCEACGVLLYAGE